VKFDLSQIEKVFFCSGARNHDLLSHFNPDKIQFEVDERMASFKALGLAKLTKNPVMICCTSGTAVAECLPALLEAKFSRTPIILISGDRPKKMHGTGAPQTINHEAVTKNNVGQFIELTYSEFKSFSYDFKAWPVHINVLIDDTEVHKELTKLDATVEDFASFIQKVKSPLFLFSHEENSMRPFIQKFAKTGLPFYAESLSDGRDLSTIDSEKTLIKLLSEKTFDGVVRIGHTPLSKSWRVLEMKHLPVMSFDARNLPALSYGTVAPLSSQDLLQSEKWWNELKKLNVSSIPQSSNIDSFLEKYPLSEMSVLRQVQSKLQSDDIIYLGNSLIIRFFELVQKNKFNLFGSRGVNGIDGQLATAIGMALGTKQRVYAILGDMTTLYDLSALRDIPENLTLIIINNGGGRIFDMLGLDTRIVMNHDLHFRDLCQGFGVSYAQNDLTKIVSVQVLELNPDQNETRALLKEWNS
jgi:2-succinyl-5-enolpyruvyl-6-hydroxy-3-cyclohexene-1-carboxylate synthase